MPWYVIVAAVCLVIGPFDALYLYIRASRRRDALRREREAREAEEAARRAAGERPKVNVKD